MDSDVLRFVLRGEFGHLTVNEICLLQIRALAVAIFFAVGTLMGGPLTRPLPCPRSDVRFGGVSQTVSNEDMVRMLEHLQG